MNHYLLPNLHSKLQQIRSFTQYIMHLFCSHHISTRVEHYGFLWLFGHAQTYFKKELLNSMWKLCPRSQSKMPTTMKSKFLKFVYRKSCVDQLQFQTIYWLNRRPYFSLLDLKQKHTRYVAVSTNWKQLICLIVRIITQDKTR